MFYYEYLSVNLNSMQPYPRSREEIRSAGRESALDETLDADSNLLRNILKSQIRTATHS